MNIKGCMLSNSNEWETPQELFDELNEEFHFTLDPCATEENHKCEKYFTPETDGLSQSWGGEKVFVNLPYGRKIGKWVQKAWEESTKPNTLVVLLVPSRTDTKWFQEYIYHRCEIRFISGRVRFGESNTNAPFPSMLAIYRSGGMKCR